MIYSLCNTCLQPYELMVEASDIYLIKQIADAMGYTCLCPRLCGGRINLVGDSTIEQMSKDTRLRTPMRLSGKELYKAVNGLGLPDEIPSSKEMVDAVLSSGHVEGFSVVEIDRRIYLTELRMPGGLTLHLSSGPHGAQVLKVTKARRAEDVSTSNPR